MFRLTWTEPFEGPIGTLRLTRDPRWHGLGHYTDADGVRWDVCAIRGDIVNARRVNAHPDYYGTHTGTSSQGFHRWEPYRIELAED